MQAPGFRTVWPEPLAEGATAILTAVLRDPADVGVNPDTCVLTLYEKTTVGVLNGRTDSNIKNANGGTIDGSGNLSLELTPADMAVVLERRAEWHVALFKYTWNGGTRSAKHELEFQVVNLQKVP